MSTSRPWWRSPTVIVVAGCLIAIITFGVRTSFGLFTAPLTDLRGWDREAFALAIAIQNLLWGLGQPFAGAVADRYGAGRVLATGGLVYALGVALMAFSTSPGALTVTGGVLVGLGVAGGSFTIVIAAFARLVEPSRRSWAMGLATAAGSMGQFLFAPLGQGFIDAYGAETALILLSCTLLVVPLLARSLTGRGDDVDEPGSEHLSARGALSAAVRHPSYLLLTSGFFVCGFHIAFITTHLPPYLTDQGLSKGLAAWSLSLIGLFNVIGAYSSGILGGRHPRRLLLSGIYLGRGVAFAIFLLMPPTTGSVLLFSALIGLLWLSTVPLTSGLVALMFGTRHVGMLFGVVFLSHQVGAFIGALLGGTIYEASGSYDVMWIICIALSVAAALVHLPIRERSAGALAPSAA
ncbi:MFS transporter [Solirubrobacter sp. CPCC 204708]|uniref:MFS transporter n=1 Tax=Solirubrobacter deserti TaxID=2282478 RepID=A0ABT4RJ59_9ACTN|nr:MFS transporter [Solirubrobacter deserti]MBE2317649.1 MFS transporter [Solirubrobacter deserti]MDA0138599.1 MFS transporter [Solirubrobacter deserti]